MPYSNSRLIQQFMYVGVGPIQNPLRRCENLTMSKNSAQCSQRDFSSDFPSWDETNGCDTVTTEKS